MTKKINKNTIKIKGLLKRGYRQCEISITLNIKKEKNVLLSKSRVKRVEKRDTRS